VKRFSCTCIVGRLIPNGLESYRLPDGACLRLYGSGQLAKLSRHVMARRISFWVGLSQHNNN
jgi:hypothetical protein